MFLSDVMCLLTLVALVVPTVPQTKSAASAAQSRSSHSVPRKSSGTRSGYVGNEACRSCHGDIVASYDKTAHHLTSQVADKNSIVGTFQTGTNILKTSNPNLFFQMDAKEDGYFQTAVSGTPPRTFSRSERLDLVIGSGGKGQTYLYWNGDLLFQLPVGYSTVLHQWIDSPGYRDGTADFDRPTIPRCLECHATYFEAMTPPMGNLYNTKNFVLGISCERCHGPGRDHVAAYTSKPAPHSGTAIINPAKLARAGQFDVCAQCHGGPGERQMSSLFSYVPGQPLDKYIDLGSVDSGADIDVHGKQVLMLKKSRCFQASANMSCSTCHDVHKPERNLAEFSQRCLSCHQIEACGMYPKKGREIADNCIDCHMPNQSSKVVFLDVNGERIAPQFRTHWIKVYPESKVDSELANPPNR